MIVSAKAEFGTISHLGKSWMVVFKLTIGFEKMMRVNQSLLLLVLPEK
jgi:hypothetical protein